MSKFKKEKVMPRYLAIAVALTIVGVAILGKAFYTMTVKKEFWTTVSAKQKRDSVITKSNRGNILSCDGQLMATSIPEYKPYVDFQPGRERHAKLDTAVTHKLDTLWMENIDSLCAGLHNIFPKRSAEEFKTRLLEGRRKVMKDGTVGARHWEVWPRRIDYNTYCELKKLPIFNLPTNKGGFHCETYNSRRRPFGSLASRTLGGLKAASDSAYFGLELSYDSILRGHNGLVRKEKVLNRVLDMPVAPPIDGADVVTTIDVGMQDLAERALIDELKKPTVNGDMGVAIVMEVATGDVKAIVNMTKCADGVYREVVNNAISYRCEPGSVFKVASILVALDDGVVDTTFQIATGIGVMQMHGRNMKDHNWRRGGYQTINVARTLEVSSNIGVSYVIDKFYGGDPKKYVEGLHRVGIGEDLRLPIVGYLPPYIRMPDTKTTNRAKYWSKTTLPWMSIGYETQIAPINTLAFYNAIANDGRMMRPRFVQRVVKDGKVLVETKPEVVKEHIAKPQTIKTMQTVLAHVVSQGLGKPAGSSMFHSAGKTGTAQVADQHGGYHSGTTRYWLSFCGYFPVESPRYSCIVCIRKTGTPASGGGMSGLVFRNISEGIMSQYLKYPVELARDTTSVLIPEVKNGNILAADYVLGQLGVFAEGGWSGSYPDGTPVWGRAERDQRNVTLSEVKPSQGVMPSVVGMGARDAVYLLEQRGLKVRLQGRGHVRRQSVAQGTTLKSGMTCDLILD